MCWQETVFKGPNNYSKTHEKINPFCYLVFFLTHFQIMLKEGTIAAVASFHLLLNQLEVRSLCRLETEFAHMVQNEAYEHLVLFSFGGDVSSLESIGLDILSYPYGMIQDSKTKPEEKCRLWTPDTKRLKNLKRYLEERWKRSWKILEDYRGPWMFVIIPRELTLPLLR